MTGEENKQLVRQFYEELLVEHNLAVVDDLLSEYFVCHENRGPGYEEITRDPEGIKEAVRMCYSAFPDQKATIDEISAVEDRIVTHWTIKGTQYGPFLGIAPTRKRVTIKAISIDRVVLGKIVESWLNWDLADLLRQLEILEFGKAA